ncbi:Laminin-like protein epi-1 [Termitomyces sp. J132]|nr:Laminin-like protein epi-1 [Termitomyces sp. J132]
MRYLRPYYASGENPNSPHIIVRDPDDRAVVSCASDILLQAHPSITDNLRAGEQRSVWIVSHQGTSQYRFFGAGQTSCGLCASNFVRQVFKRYISGTTGRDLLRWLLSRECTTEITDIAQYYRHSVYLEVANIVGAPSYQRELGGGASYIEEAVSGLPYFTEALIVDTPTDNIKCSYSSFLQLLNTMDEKKEIAAAIITQPPEIIAAMKIPNPTSKTGIFVIFDSHGHTDLGYPQSSGIIICHRPEDAAAFLAARQPVQDELQRQVLAASFVRPKASLARISEKAQQRSLMLSMNMLNNEIGKTIQSKSSPPKVSDTHHRPRTLQVTQSQAEIGEAMRENLEINLDTANQQIKELKQQLQSQNTEIAKANEITNSAIAKAKEIEQKMTEMEKSARQSESNAPKVSDTPQRRRPRTLQVTESQAEIGEAIVENLKANLKNTDQRVKELEQQLESQKIAARKEIAKANEITNNAIARANEIEQKMTEMEKSARQSESNAPISDTVLPQRRRPRTLQVTESQAEIGEAIVENLKANLKNTDQRVKELEQQLESQKIAARKEIAKANEITNNAIARANEIEQKMTEMEKSARQSESNAPISDTPQRRRPRTLQVTESQAEIGEAIVENLKANLENTDQRVKELEQQLESQKIAARKEIAKANEITNNAIARANEIEQKMTEMEKSARQSESNAPKVSDTPQRRRPRTLQVTESQAEIGEAIVENLKANLENTDQRVKELEQRLKSQKIAARKEIAKANEITKSAIARANEIEQKMTEMEKFGRRNRDLEVAYKVLQKITADMRRAKEEAQDAWFAAQKKLIESKKHAWALERWGGTANHTPGSQSSAKLNNQEQPAPHRSRDKMTSKHDAASDAQKTRSQQGGTPNHTSGSQSSARFGKLNNHEQPAPRTQSREELTSKRAPASDPQTVPIQWDTRTANHTSGSQSSARTDKLNNHGQLAPHTQSRDKMTSKRDTFGLDPQKTPPQSGAGANHASGSQSSARTGKLNKHEQPAPHAQSRDEMTSVHDASASNAQKTPIQWDTRAASHAPETQDGRIGELNHVPPAADSQSRDMHQISTTAADPFDRTKEPQFTIMNSNDSMTLEEFVFRHI